LFGTTSLDGGTSANFPRWHIQQQLNEGSGCRGIGGANVQPVAAVAPDAGETVQSQLDKYPTPIFGHIEVADGRVWMLPEGVKDFAGDLPEQEQKVVWATHFAPDADLFNQKVEGTAWKSKPSWSIVATEDRTVHPDLERFLAKRMGATTVEAKSSHVAMLSQPQLVLDVIRKAAKAAQGAAATA
jgi:pimeloyl-ACP methyl ester carboxylesterase